MKKKKISPEHAFGKAYPEWLNMLENLEDFVEGRTKKMKRIMYPSLLFPNVDKSSKQFLIWAANAACMRSSFKFKITQDNWDAFKKHNDNELSVVTFCLLKMFTSSIATIQKARFFSVSSGCWT